MGNGATDASTPPDASARLPTPGADRLFSSYSGFAYTLMTIAAAIWIVLIGGVLPSVGDTRLGIIGYACGAVIGVVLVVLSVAIPAYRHGIDAVDVAKAALGIRGSLLVLIGLMVSALGWAGVALAMMARGGASLVAGASAPGAVADERLVLALALGLVLLVVWLLRGGLDAIRRLNQIAGPGFLLLAMLSMGLLAHRYGLQQIWLTDVPAAQALTADRLKSLAYAIDFGVTISLTWWPYMGELYRHVEFRRHTVGPIMVGGTVAGNVFSAMVAALAAVNFGSPDPAVWLVALGGPIAGSLLVALVLLLSLPAVCLLVFLVATSLRQLGALARVGSQRLAVLAVAPLVLVAFNTEWTLVHVVTVGTLGSLVFFPICGIVAADYWILRRGAIDLPQLFVAGRGSRYWYRGGVNWIAMGVIVLMLATYLQIYDPVTLQAGELFRYLGAAFPVTVASGVLYVLLMTLAARVSPAWRRARAEAPSAGSGDIEVGL